jgi:hypothetical protein
MVRLRRLEVGMIASEAIEERKPGGSPGADAPFLSDPAMDRFAAAFLRLLSEHWVVTEKLANLVQLLEEKQLVTPDELKRIARDSEADPERDRLAADFARRILAPLREKDGS